MSDRERSRSRNGSRAPVVKESKLPRGHSRSRSRSPPHKPHKKYSPSRSRSGSVRRSYRARYSRSRSRSYSPRGSYARRSHSHSPMSTRRRHMGDRSDVDFKTSRTSGSANVESSKNKKEFSFRQYDSVLEHPTVSRCLGIFGLSVYTTEQQINHIFSKYGPVERVQVVIDAKTGRSRGFCFVYFESLEDAKVAKEECTGMEIDDRRIRVDYSITQRAHTPTPGIYMGKPTLNSGGIIKSPPKYRVNRDNGYDRRRGSDRDEYYGRSSGGYRDRGDYYSSRRGSSGGGGGGYRGGGGGYGRSYGRSPSPQYRERERERERVPRSSRRYERSRSRSYSPRRYY